MSHGRSHMNLVGTLVESLRDVVKWGFQTGGGISVQTDLRNIACQRLRLAVAIWGRTLAGGAKLGRDHSGRNLKDSSVSPPARGFSKSVPPTSA